MNETNDRIIELVDKAMTNSGEIMERISKTMKGENLIACMSALLTLSSSVLEHMLETGGDNPYMHSICESAVTAHLKQLADVCDQHGITLEKELELVRRTPESVLR